MRAALLPLAVLVAGAGGIATLGRDRAAHRSGENPAVHPTTEADLHLLRLARPTLDGPVLGGLRMRWCVEQRRCREMSGR